MAFAVGGTVDGGIVNYDHMSICRKLYVKLNAIGAILQGLLKGWQGIFWRVGRVTAMRENDGARKIFNHQKQARVNCLRLNIHKIGLAGVVDHFARHGGRNTEVG